MYCSNCGTKITEEETRFCPKCGMPVSYKPNEYGSKLVLAIMAVIVTIFLGYIFFTGSNKKQKNSDIAVKLNQKKGTPKRSKKESIESSSNNLVPSTTSSNSLTATTNSKNSIDSKIASALTGFRHSLDISNFSKQGGKTIKVKLFLDNQSEKDILDAFASFFAVCYGNNEFKTAYASISLLKNGNKIVTSMGIGRIPASSISSATWRRFDKMGNQLKSWVLTKQNNNPGSNESACYFNKIE